MREGITAGTAAREAQVNVETLRFYEKRGLLPPPRRTAANYRVYSQEDVRRLRFVKHAQQLGFSLSEIEELLSLRAKPGNASKAVCDRARAKIAGIDEKIAALTRMRDVLQSMVNKCDGTGPVSSCVILRSLEEGESSKKGES